MADSVFVDASRCLKASPLNSDNGTIQLRLTVLSIFKKFNSLQCLKAHLFIQMNVRKLRGEKASEKRREIYELRSLKVSL